MDEAEAQGYRGQIVMNAQDDFFFPSLTVGQTMDLATKTTLSARLSEFETPGTIKERSKSSILTCWESSHTAGTKVGNEFVRGVSGGERKRVSIAEVFTTQASVYCWDNSTRGLDASTAFEWTRAIRAMTDILGLTTIVTLYQAGNGIFNLFDKVLVLDQSKEIFYGRREDAQPFMETTTMWKYLSSWQLGSRTSGPRA